MPKNTVLFPFHQSAGEPLDKSVLQGKPVVAFTRFAVECVGLVTV